MASFHKSVSTAKKDQEEKKNTAVSKLEQFLLERRGARQPVDDLQEFERELHSLFAAAEAEVVGHEVERFDIDLPFVTVDGIVHQRVLRCEDTYFCASGPVQVMRSLYSTRKESERAICPMELQAGLVEGRWTPHCGETSDVGRISLDTRVSVRPSHVRTTRKILDERVVYGVAGPGCQRSGRSSRMRFCGHPSASLRARSVRYGRGGTSY